MRSNETLEFGSPLLMQEALRNASSSTLEIGAGCDFYSAPSENSVYVGLNIDPRQHERLSEQAEDNKFSVYFDLRTLAGDTGQDPDITAKQLQYFWDLFGGCTFTTLKMNNVFGENPGRTHFGRTPINPLGNDYLGSSSNDQKLASLRIGTELLIPGGTLLIRENQTPSAGMGPKLLANPGILEQYGYGDIELSVMEGESVYDMSPPYDITATKL